MVGRWTGNDVAAVGISLGFERVVDLVSLDAAVGGVVLVLEDGSASVVANALRVQADLIALGHAVRLEQRPKKLNLLLESMVEQGFTQWASVDAATVAATLKALA
jgi:histidyl-tRNA synthetase